VSRSQLSFGPQPKIGLDDASSQVACLVYSTTPERAVRSRFAGQPAKIAPHGRLVTLKRPRLIRAAGNHRKEWTI
jgi:hypothetical protein